MCPARFVSFVAIANRMDANPGHGWRAPETLVGLCMATAAVACGSTEPGPSFQAGQLSLEATTGGYDLDRDGYLLEVDDGNPIRIPVNGTLVVSNLPVGEHRIRVSGLEPNCQVNGQIDRVITVVREAPARETLDVSCAALGRVTVAVTTQGDDLDFNGYRVSLSALSQAFLPVGANDTVAFTPFLVPAALSIELTDVASNCTISGPSMRSLTLPQDGRLTVAYHVDCVAAPGSITVAVRSVGYALDPDGYGLALDNTPSVAVGLSEDVVFTDLGVGAHQLTLTGVSSNCYPVGGPVWSVVLDPLQQLTLPVQVRCTPLLAVSTVGGQIQVGEGNQFTTIASGSWVAWSPTGTRVVVGSLAGDLWLMDSDGGNASKLTQWPAGEPASADTPTWSPDGTKIAFSHVAAPFFTFKIAVINPDGSGFAVLNPNTTIRESDPTWSPTSTQIAFVAAPLNSTPQLHLMNADGTGRTQLLSSGQVDLFPSWSPSGQFIAFVRATGSGSELLRLRLSDGQVSTVATWHSLLQYPQWAPTGTHLLAVTENHELVVVPAGGGQPVVIWDSVLSAAWRP